MTYKTLVEAAARLTGAEAYIDFDTVHRSVLSQLVNNNRQALNSAHQALGPDCAVDLRYEESFFDELCRQTMHLRNLAVLFRAEAWLAESDWDFAVAAQLNIDGLQLANVMRRGALVVEMLSGIAISNIALESLDRIRVHFDERTRYCVRAALQRLQTEREPFEDIIARDQAWESAVGWANESRESVVPTNLDPDECGITKEEQAEIFDAIQRMVDLPADVKHQMQHQLDQKTIAHMQRLITDLA